jgi:hypothetical protein
VLPNGNQLLLIGPCGALLEFSVDGALKAVSAREASGPSYELWLKQWLREVPFTDAPIRVRRFAALDGAVRVEDLYDYEEEFLLHPDSADFGEEERRELPGVIRESLSEGVFHFSYRGAQFDVARDGEVIGS